MTKKPKAPKLFDGAIIVRAIIDSFRKLNPKLLARNPVIFVTGAVAALVTALWLRDFLNWKWQCRVFRPDRCLALVYRALCKLRRSRGRRPWQGPG